MTGFSCFRTHVRRAAPCELRQKSDMSQEACNLINLVEKLRQEHEFVSFYKSQIRQGVQDLNSCCDNVFHTLWLNHALGYGLQKVISHHVPCVDWSQSYEALAEVEFVNASRSLQPNLLVERYSLILTTLLTHPQFVSEILHWAESKGLDVPLLCSDLMSVVYGHCIFQRPHNFFLQLIKEMLRRHVDACQSRAELFSGVDPVFNCILSEYCGQLVDFKTFLTETLQGPLLQVLACDEYLEFDVHKAGCRFQALMESQNTASDGTKFLFSEDLESSCEQLSALSSLFVQNISKHMRDFPVSLKWILGTMKFLVRQKWPETTLENLRRPVGDLLFGLILSSAIVNPDSYGIVDPSLVIGPTTRYNLSQITCVLQGCAWILSKSGNTRYPIQKVVKKIDAKAFFSVVDSIDNGYGGETPDTPSCLPGLRRSAYLASQAQLNNLVGLLQEMASSLSFIDIRQNPALSLLSPTLALVLPKMSELSAPSPYSVTAKSPPPSSSNSADATPTKSLSRLSTGKRKGLDLSKPPPSQRLIASGKKAVSATTFDLHSPPPFGRYRTFSRGATPSPALERQQSVSPPRQLSEPVPTASFSLPSEVLILPILERAGFREGQTTTQWDFDLLTEEEFMAPSPQTPASRPHHTPSVPLTPAHSPLHLHLLHPSHSRQRGHRRQSRPSLPLIISPQRNHEGSFVFPSPSGRASPRFSSARRTPPASGNGSPVVKSLRFNETESLDSRATTLPAFLSPGPMSPAPKVSLASAVGESSPASMSRQSRPPPSEVSFESEVTTASVENLLEASVFEETLSPKKGRLKKLRERLKKRPRALTVASKSRRSRSKTEILRAETSSTENLVDDSKPRSKSEQVHKVSIDNDSESPDHYQRNKPHRSYTLLTADITEKYVALVAKNRDKAAMDRGKSEGKGEGEREETQPSSLKSDVHGTKPYDDVKVAVARMPQEKFRKSLYCDQLKYKLRTALQGIHTSLSTSPVYMQLNADEDAKLDSRYQLMTLLQGALQRGKWQHADMEIALLSETLRMVEPLPNQLVAEAINGVYEECNRRSSYFSYLVKSHQKFQDARLQVLSVQTAADRVKEVQEEVFVNFVVRLFLEDQETELKKFSRDMESLSLADERCSLMETSIDKFAAALHESSTWLTGWADMSEVVRCLEDHLFAHVYSHIFHPNGEPDMTRDQIFSEHLARFSDFLTPTHHSLQIPPVYHSSCPWMAAQKHLQMMVVFKSPRGKLHCIVQSCRVLISLLQYAKCGDPPGADDMFPVLVYILIMANPSSLLSTVQYVKNFAEKHLSGEDAYWWAQCSTAVEFTKTLE